MATFYLNHFLKITFLLCLLQYFQDTEKYFMWCAWWVGLGVLSSVGFGTGLHTFLLYLGPHIAAVRFFLMLAPPGFEK